MSAADDGVREKAILMPVAIDITTKMHHTASYRVYNGSARTDTIPNGTAWRERERHQRCSMYCTGEVRTMKKLNFDALTLFKLTFEMLSALEMLALMSLPNSRRPVANFAKRDIVPRVASNRQCCK